MSMIRVLKRHPGSLSLAGGLASLLAILFACSPTKPPAGVRCSGVAPVSAIYADTRVVAEICPLCGKPVPREATQCASCGDALSHPHDAACGFCRSEGTCDACTVFRTNGECRYCKGTGRLDPNTPCFSCRGTGSCTACGGSSKCSACAGTGRIALPWSAPQPPPPPQSPASATPAPILKADPWVAWIGESVQWVAAPGTAADWTIYRSEGNQRIAAGERPNNNTRFQPDRTGSFVAESGAFSVCFEVVNVSEQRAAGGAAGGDPGTVEFSPLLRDAKIRWEQVAGKDPKAAPQAWPLIEIPGLPARRGPRPLSVGTVEIRLTPPTGGFLLAEVPTEFTVHADIPLPSKSSYEWILTPASSEQPTPSAAPVRKIVFPKAGRYQLQVRWDGNVSNRIDIDACAISMTDTAGKRLHEAAIGSPGKVQDREKGLTEEAIAGASRAMRVVVEDPSESTEDTILVRTSRRDGKPLNPPVRVPLTLRDGRRQTAPILLLSDAIDDSAEAAGVQDDAPGDRTLLAEPGGTMEVVYRSLPPLAIAVGPTVMHPVTIRFVAVQGPRPQQAPLASLERTLDDRLEQANRVWERFGIRFIRRPIETLPLPRNLLMLSGRAAGVDRKGRPVTARIAVNDATYSVATSWNSTGGPSMPKAVAAAFAHRLGTDWEVDRSEQLFPGDPGAIVLALRLRKGGSVTVKRVAGEEDISQIIAPIEGDLSDGCHVSLYPRVLTLDEINILVGLNDHAVAHLDIYLVDDLVSLEGGHLFKVYPEGAFPSSVARSAIVSWKTFASAERYPYVLARVLGELLLDPEKKFSDEDTLFREPLEETASLGGNKRVGEATGASVAARGRAVAFEK